MNLGRPKWPRVRNGAPELASLASRAARLELPQTMPTKNLSARGRPGPTRSPQALPPASVWHKATMAAFDAMLLLDERRRVVAANRAALRMYRVRSAKRLVGRNLRDLRPPRTRRQLAAHFREVDRTGRGRWEAQHLRADGVEIAIEASVRRVRTKTWRGYVYLARDVSSGKRAEEQLRLAELAHRKLAKQLAEEKDRLVEAQAVARVGSWDIDLRSGRLYRSDQTFRIFGLRPDKLRATYATFLRRVHPDDRKAMHAAHAAALAGKAKVDIEHRIVLPDQSVRFVHELGELMRDKSGRPIRLSGTIHDITEQKRKDEELRAGERQLHALVERLNSVREEEAKRIARELHDELGQRLTAISMEVTALEPILLEATPENRDPIARLHAAIDQSIEAVQKISSELRLGQLDLLGLTAAIDWHVQEFSRLSGISYRIRRLDEAADLSDAHRTAIFRILQEALTNVARHAAATQVVVSLEADRESITLMVRDNGRGIAEIELMDRKSIGLLGMRERAQAAGGTVRIRGDRGRGTTVSMRLPRIPAGLQKP